MFLFQLLVGFGMQLLAGLLRPKPKQASQPQQDIKRPTVDAGRPIPVVFGSVQIKDPNCLYFGQAYHNKRTSEELTAESGGGGK